MDILDGLSCGLPLNRTDQVLLAHGGGGRWMQQLIHGVFRKQFTSSFLATEHDAAALPLNQGTMAFTTDTYVIRPIFFPGGDIGKLSVYGTVNDLAMAGARPLYLSVGMILEEGFSMDSLKKISGSLQEAAEECSVEIVTGDTKVVERGKGDGIFINTSGVGVIEHSLRIQPSSVREGDAIILSGDLGRHGIAIMAARDGLEFETSLESDCAPLASMVLGLLKSGIELHCMRDLTRGGLASALNEISVSAGCQISIEEERIPVQSQVRGICEILGLDPLYVANEGRMVAFVPHEQAHRAVEIMKSYPVGIGASVIGKVSCDSSYLSGVSGASGASGSLGRVSIKSRIGVSRILDLLSGDQLPRIC